MNLLVLALFGCATPIARARVGEPAPPSAVTADVDRRVVQHPHREGGPRADARFVRDMIAHHAQALAMTSLAPARAGGDDIRLLAERLDVSQRDEIALLRSWLSDREEPARGDSLNARHPGPSSAMPGMLTPSQLAELEAAEGAEFDRLFLDSMIRHHEGALVMIRELFATPGAGQDAEVFRFASEIEADQLIEIARMRQMLAAISRSTPPGPTAEEEAPSVPTTAPRK